MILTNSQQNVVDKLVKRYLSGARHLYLKAPTGSGKTFIASTFISEILAEAKYRNQKIMVIIATISNADLPKAFAKKLKQYKKYHPKFNTYQVEHIESPSKAKNIKYEGDLEIKIEDKKVIVFGTSSFSSSSLFTQHNVLKNFVHNSKTQGYKLVYLRDEAHIGTKVKKTEAKRIDDIMHNNANFILEMTATPKSSTNLIELTEQSMNEDDKYLLKQKRERVKLEDNVSNAEVIDQAIKQFKKNKVAYNNLKTPNGEIINPAMLVQIDNEASVNINPEKNRRFQEALALLESKLQRAGLKYLKYLDKKEVIGTSAPTTLDYASQNDATIDAIIFKVGPAIGWDIPRANMLLQLRDVSSENLNIQTIGRIKRNPYPNLKYNETTNKYWIYSNYQEKSRQLANYKLKEKFDNLRLLQGIIDVNHQLIQSDLYKYRLKLVKWLEDDFAIWLENLMLGNKNWVREIIYQDDLFALSKKQVIPNIIILLIENYSKWEELNKKQLFFSQYFDYLKNLAKKYDVSIEVIKYFLISKSQELEELKNSTMRWPKYNEVYKINDKIDLMKNYDVWFYDSEEKKTPKVNISGIENYGYELISSKNEAIQYFDSKPEKAFFEKLLTFLDSKWKDVQFLARMPSLGSKIYYEYFNHEKGMISKSYMDFAILFKNRVIMFEIKGFESDYNPEKTRDLKTAYKLYMENNKNWNLELIVYQYDVKKQKQLIDYFDGEKWNSEKRTSQVFEKILG